MPHATYILELELAYNTWTDVAADWHTAAPLVIERGIEPGERIAGVGRMAFALHNPDGRYTPGHANARPGFEVGIGVRLRASDGASTRALFTGRLAAITPRQAAGASAGPPLWVEVVCLDDMAALTRVPVGAFPLMVGAAPGDLVERLVTRTFVPPGRLATWRLGHPQAGRLGQATTVSGPETGVDLDAGQSLFAWAGDTWPPDLPALAALRDVCASEGGWFFIAADGTPVFRDRHARPRHLTPDATLDGGLAGLQVERGQARAANRVETTTYPRAVGTAEAVLWQAGHSLCLLPGKPRTITCPYRDPDEQVARVGALSVVTPLAGTDFTATDRADGTGVDVAHYVVVRTEPGGASARITLENRWPANRPVYVHGLQVRGVPLRTYYPAVAVAVDAASQLALGLHPSQVDMPLQDDAGVGEDMARALLANRATPRSWLTVIVEATVSPTLLLHALARDVGDRLHVTDAALGLDAAACFIEAVRHEVRRGGASHQVTWRTRPADLEAYWALGGTGHAALGTGARLGY